MTRPEPRWLGRLVIDETHFRQIREHGGAHGLRDENALESALARPRQRWEYEDGNKRVGLIAMVAFLDRNGSELTATIAEAISAILAVAAGTMSEAALAEWLEAHSRAA